MVDRSSSVLIAPGSFVAFFQSFDDYGTRWPIASIFRLLRFFGFFVGIFFPAIYIAVISFNHELIPLKLLLNIGQAAVQAGIVSNMMIIIVASTDIA